MNIENFEAFRDAALVQALPQRLPFVFAGAHLPDESSAQQRAQCKAGTGGALVPLMCVDKSPDELSTFDAFMQEAAQFGVEWKFVFAGAVARVVGHAMGHEETEVTLHRMVEAIKCGDFSNYLAFDRCGLPVKLKRQGI